MLSLDSLFIGTLRTGTEVGAPEGWWNFQGRDDVMVPMRKLKLAESEELCTASLPRGDVIMVERRGRRRGEVGCALEGSGTPTAVTKTKKIIVNPTGRVQHSHLREGTCRQGNHAVLGGCHLQELHVSPSRVATGLAPKRKGELELHVRFLDLLQGWVALYVSLGIKSPALNVQRAQQDTDLLTEQALGARPWASCLIHVTSEPTLALSRGGVIPGGNKDRRTEESSLIISRPQS